MAKLQPLLKLTEIKMENGRVCGLDSDGTKWTQFLKFPKRKARCQICKELMETGAVYWQNTERQAVCDHHVSF